MAIRCHCKAREHNCNENDVIVVGLVDYNVPGATIKKKYDALSDGITTINDLSPAANMCIIFFPDNAKKSSARGLYEEEKNITDSLYANRQWSDAKFIELFRRPRRSEPKSNSRKWGEGRVVVNYDSKSDNIWIQNSELVLSGRPMGSAGGDEDDSPGVPPTACLPKAAEMFQPVATNADEDLHMAEVFSPGVEQRAAQKGAARFEIVIDAAFTNMQIKTPSLVVSLTGYVEDAGLAASILIASYEIAFKDGECFVRPKAFV